MAVTHDASVTSVSTPPSRENSEPRTFHFVEIDLVDFVERIGLHRWLTDVPRNAYIDCSFVPCTVSSCWNWKRYPWEDLLKKMINGKMRSTFHHLCPNSNHSTARSSSERGIPPLSPYPYPCSPQRVRHATCQDPASTNLHALTDPKTDTFRLCFVHCKLFGSFVVYAP